MARALKPAWTKPCIDDAPVDRPTVNDDLLSIIEVYDAALKDCDDRMAKVREAQPGDD